MKIWMILLKHKVIWKFRPADGVTETVKHKGGFCVAMTAPMAASLIAILASLMVHLDSSLINIMPG